MKAYVSLSLFLFAFGNRASAQIDELLPEINATYKLNQDVRCVFQAKETREAGDPTTSEIGPSFDFYLKRLSRLIDIVNSDPDDSKSQLLVFSFGYRYLPTPGEPPTNRLEPVLTIHFPVPKTRLLFSDRNRADLDWKDNKFSWRYRNRVQLERSISIHSYRFSPYVSAEFFYESQYQKWADTALYAGCLFPIGGHVRFNPYYEYQNITGKRPNELLDQLGLALDLYF